MSVLLFNKLMLKKRMLRNRRKVYFYHPNIIKPLKNEEYLYPININRFIAFTKKKSEI